MGSQHFTKREPWAKFLFGTGYTLQVKDETGGTISGAGIYPEGASVRIQATMEENYFFQKWELEGSGTIENASQNPTTFTMGAGNATISAEYLTPQENGPFDVLCQGTSAYSYDAANKCLKLKGNGPFTVSVKDVQSTPLAERIWIYGDDAEVTLQDIHLDLSSIQY